MAYLDILQRKPHAIYSIYRIQHIYRISYTETSGLQILIMLHNQIEMFLRHKSAESDISISILINKIWSAFGRYKTVFPIIFSLLNIS